MLTTFNDEYKKWVHVKTGIEPEIPVAQVLDFVIDSRNGKFEAVWVKSLGGMKLISVKNILHWNPFEMLVEEENDLVVPDKFPQAEALEKKDFPILGAKVFVENTKGDYLGKVYNFVFDTLSPQILAIHVRSSLFPWATRRIIQRGMIKRITKEGIFVTKNFADVRDLVKVAKELLNKKKLPDFEDCNEIKKYEYKKFDDKLKIPQTPFN